MLGREVYANPFLLKDVDERIFGEVKQHINEKEVLENYLDYVIFMKNKGFNSSIMLKHIFGLKRGKLMQRFSGKQFQISLQMTL